MSGERPSTSPFAVRRQLATLQRGARKSLGQHFLHNAGIARRIVALAGLHGDEHVVEVGPGLGALSEILAPCCARLSLIELDSDLARDLRERFAAQPHVQVVEADVLRVDFSSLLNGGPAIAVANLPYNVANAVLAHMLASRRFVRLVLMVQWEVARRLTAKPGSKEYGVLSVFTQSAASIRLAFKVAPGSFVPRPKVDSAVVVVEPHPQPVVAVQDPQTFERVVRTVFHQRRKQLRNSLKPLSAAPLEVLERAGVDAERRPETLSLSELAAIADALTPTGHA